jgi:hypothetical protein
VGVGRRFTSTEEAAMADELDPMNENEEIGRTDDEEITSSADGEEFEDIDEAEDDEEDLES